MPVIYNQTPGVSLTCKFAYDRQFEFGQGKEMSLFLFHEASPRDFTAQNNITFSAAWHKQSK